jgi:hypothetical protein
MRVYSAGFVHLYDITNWQALEEVRRHIGNSVLTLELLPDNPAVHFLQRNGFLVREGTPYIIKHIIQDTELVTVTAHGCHVMLEQRITGGGATKNERLTKTGSADTVVKHFITQSKGDLPLVCAASRGGASISDQTRLKPLGDEVARILSGAGLGEKFTLDATEKKIVFDTYAGVDRTRGNAGDNPPVVFDLDFGNIAEPRYIEDATQEQSTIYVGGAGEEDEREIVIIGDDATGLDRVERFRDARDVVAGDTDTLTERGEQGLVGTQAAVDVEALAGTGLVYGTDYELGDIVTCRVPRKNYTVDGEYFNPVDEIVEVNQRITEVVITQEEDREHVDLRFGDTPVAPTTLQSLQREVAQLKSTEAPPAAAIDLSNVEPSTIKQIVGTGLTMTGGLDVGGYDLQNSLIITGSNGNAYETYPQGFSHATINVDNYAQDSGENFPKQYGTLLTVNQERTRMFQLLFNTAASEIFTRSYVYTSGFSPWRHLTSPRLLWGPGSWSNGELTVPDSSKYSVFIVATDFVSMFVHKLSATELIGIGGSCRTADQYIAALSASYSENIWTWGSIKRMYHKESTTHDSLVDITVTNIYGIA